MARSPFRFARIASAVPGPHDREPACRVILKNSSRPRPICQEIVDSRVEHPPTGRALSRPAGTAQTRRSDRTGREPGRQSYAWRPPIGRSDRRNRPKPDSPNKAVTASCFGSTLTLTERGLMITRGTVYALPMHRVLPPLLVVHVCVA